MKLRFGDVTFDGGRRLLIRGPDVVHISPKAFQLLDLLLTRRPDAVSKVDIQEALWPRTFVSETNLPALVNEVRNALGDHAKEPEFVRTVHGFGYAFEAPVREVPAEETSQERHILIWGSHEIRLAEGPNLVGRERTADVWIGHPSVSREHARIVVRGESAEIEDLQSRNGSFVGSVRVTGPVPLSDGNEIRLGSVVLCYRTGSSELSTESGH